MDPNPFGLPLRTPSAYPYVFPRLRSPHPTYSQFHVYEPSSTPFARANLDEPTPNQQKPEQPPSPPSVWFPFRSQTEISATTGKAWKDATPVELHPVLVDAEKVQRQTRYPNHHFSPVKKSNKVDRVSADRGPVQRLAEALEKAERGLDVFQKARYRAECDVHAREVRSERERRALLDNIYIRPSMMANLRIVEVRFSTRHGLISCMMTWWC